MVSLGGGCLTWGRGVAVVVQVSALFHIASSKEPPHMPPSVSGDGRQFLLLCFNR